MASNLRKLLLVEQYAPPHECDVYCVTGGVCPLFCCLSVCPETCKYSSPPADKDFSAPHGQHHGLSLWFTLSLVALAAFFFFFTCYTAYRIYSTWYGRRRTTPEGDDPGSDAFLQDEDLGPVVDHPIWYIRTIGLQHSVICAITAVKYKRGDGLIDGSDCAICLNEFEEDESLRLLPKCNHAFHIPCIDTWLRSHTNCPMCRAGIESLEPTPNPGVMDGDGRELRIGIDDAGNESTSQIGLTNDENLVGEEGRNNDAGGLNGEHLMRRSVSVDSFSASPITASIANAANPGQLQLVDHEKEWASSGVAANKAGINQSLLRFVGSFSMERPPQMGTPSSIKRSLSCSAKVQQQEPRNEPLNSLQY